MANMPIYCKKPFENLFLQNQKTNDLETLDSGSNDDPGLLSSAFVRENVKTVGFIETIDFY